MSDTKNNASVIEVIQQMVANGETEEKIVATLKELGVDQEQAKRLLLIGQADTFALLKGEINKIVKESVENQKPELAKFISSEAKKIGEETHSEVSKLVMADIKQYEKAITGQSKTFQEQIADNMRKVTELSDRTKDALNELGEIVEQVRIDMDEIKVKGIGARNKLISGFLILLGAVFLLLDLAIIFMNFLPQGSFINPDAMILSVILAASGIVLMFVGTNT